MRLRAPGKSIILKPVHANVGVEMAYRKALMRIVCEVHNETLDLLAALYPTPLAQDADPAAALRAQMRKLGKKWQADMDLHARAIAEGFVSGALHAGDFALQQHLKDAGFAVKFQPTEASMKAFDDALAENIKLIKSIPEQYISGASDLISESVHSGQGLAEVSKALGGRVDLERIWKRPPQDSDETWRTKTQRRANFIARDQNNRANGIINKVRNLELGITKAIWRHSGAGVTPREEHVGWDGTTFDLETGKFSDVDGEFVWAGSQCNCRCVSLGIIPGLDYGEGEDAA